MAHTQSVLFGSFGYLYKSEPITINKDANRIVSSLDNPYPLFLILPENLVHSGPLPFYINGVQYLRIFS